jgi:hypothetical protein
VLGSLPPVVLVRLLELRCSWCTAEMLSSSCMVLYLHAKQIITRPQRKKLLNPHLWFCLPAEKFIKHSHSRPKPHIVVSTAAAAVQQAQP